MAKDPQIHLLRRFSGWPSGRSIDAAEEWIRELQAEDLEGEGAHGAFATYTSRKPKRTEDLEGGSVYFCEGREVKFRMPYLGVRRDEESGRWAIMMALDFIRVEPMRVKFLRGWRYMKPSEAPADIDMPMDIPDDMEDRLRDLGVMS